MGDGGINNPWQANITLNSLADRDYIRYVAKLSKDLFGIAPAVRHRKGRNAVVVSITSTTLVDFLVSKGLIRGNKLHGGLSIPKWVLTNRSYRVACVRGLMDTDGGVFTHRHRVQGKSYTHTGLCFTSYSPALITQVMEIFEEFGIMPHSGRDGRSIYLYSKESIARYKKVFGTSNKRLSSKW